MARVKMTKAQYRKLHPPTDESLRKLLIRDKLRGLPEMGAENNFRRAMYLREL